MPQGFRRRKGVAALLAAIAVSLPAMATAQSPPMVVFDTRTSKPLTEQAFAERLERARLILIGESHGRDPDTAFQAYVLDVLARNDRRPAVVMEMITIEEAEALESHFAKGGWVADLGAALRWSERGWPAWPLYMRVLAKAIDKNLPLLAEAPAASRVRAVARGGLAGLDPADRAALGLDKPLPDPVRLALRTEIADGHCGMLPERSLDPMTDAQAYRDAALADAVLRANRVADGAVLIAGRTHVRRDVGVPVHLERLRGKDDPDAVLVIGIVAAEGAVPREPATRYDLVHLTPVPVAEEDHCAIFRERLQQR